MIKTFADKDTESLFYRILPKKFEGFHKQALRKLKMLHAATELRDLQTPPGNHLEKLQDKSLPDWSIRINDKWRLVFDFENGDAYRVEIRDYHK